MSLFEAFGGLALVCWALVWQRSSGIGSAKGTGVSQARRARASVPDPSKFGKV